MKRATFRVAALLVGIGVARVWASRARARAEVTGRAAAPACAPVAGGGSAADPLASLAAGAGSAADPLASLASVERAAAETAVPGMPSAIPAIPSLPTFATRRERTPTDRSRA